MTKINDGGPAFPQHDLSGYGMGPSMCDQTDEVYSGKYTVEGMTLRDYFAAQVLSGVYQQEQDSTYYRLAGIAYALADAMLAAREPKP